MAHDDEVVQFLAGRTAVDESGRFTDTGGKILRLPADIKTGTGIEENGRPGTALFPSKIRLVMRAFVFGTPPSKSWREATGKVKSSGRTS